MKLRYFWRNSFYSAKRDTLWGKKRTTLFQTNNWEKSSFFQRACTCTCMWHTQIHGRGAYMPPAPPAPPPPSPNKLNLHRCVCFSHTPTTQKSRLVLGPSPIMALVPFSLTPVYSMLLLILMFLVYDDFGVNHELRGSSSYPESAQNDFSIMTRRLSISIL